MKPKPSKNHWSERGRATSIGNSDALGRPRRSVLSLDRSTFHEPAGHVVTVATVVDKVVLRLGRVERRALKDDVASNNHRLRRAVRAENLSGCTLHCEAYCSRAGVNSLRSGPATFNSGSGAGICSFHHDGLS